ncbi:hypothetical protein GCM10007916_28900 [Psychromonas marina]|uniref:Type II secretion system protein n=1 Tax=Psychromonas marina TaxID=88364 RepID=A0ABQ6E3N0_9GAMM|nr:prepilin-type N-terminal cleavage/methylation domain-containing protein [Psychromonas marina]GLS91820.1 hypothetical protein GCM10007916_28900 [Psychromonas marina]
MNKVSMVDINVPKTSRINKNKKQQGVALLELIIAIGIIGILTAAVVSLASNAFASMNAKEVIQNTSQIKTGISGVYGRTGDYTNIGQPAGGGGGLDAQAFTMQDLSNPFGAELKVEETMWASVPAKGYVVIIPQLPAKQCADIVNQIGTSWAYVEIANDSTAPPTDISGVAATENIVYVDGNDEFFTPGYIGQACGDEGSPNKTVYLGAR